MFLPKNISMQQIGLIGLGTMGAALARNLASKNYKTAVFNRTFSKTEEFIENHGNENLAPFQELKDFVESLETPRKIILMVNAGEAVDQTITHLQEFIEDGDILIDCGNSNWKDTLKRQSPVAAIPRSPSSNNRKYHFIGCGVSGGEEGALLGPSIMPGGDPDVLSQILPILQDIAAKDFDGKPCVTNVGLAGAGHFVKMVHNGIEYAMMQGIAEIYDILRSKQKSNQEICEIFDNLNQGELKSFLLDITVDIFKTKDSLSDDFLIDKISSVAGAKGTGKWTVEASLNLGVFAPSISAAVMARIGSAKTQGFKTINLKKREHTSYPEPDVFIGELRSATYGLFLSSYLQGLDLINQANKDFNWNIDLFEVIRIWQGGCIIRSRLLENLYQKWTNDFDFSEQVWALDFICSGLTQKPLMVMRSSLDYLLTLSSETSLPTNLIQAQRDHFGAHTYQRIDREGVFTGGWEK